MLRATGLPCLRTQLSSALGRTTIAVPHIIGPEPSLSGARVDALMFEAFVADGEVVTPINVVHLKAKGAWFRLVLDAGTVHWRVQDKEPASWAVPEEGWEYPIREAGQNYGLVGAEISSTLTHDTPGGVRFEIMLKDGRRAVFQNYSDITSFEVLPGGASWMLFFIQPKCGLSSRIKCDTARFEE